MTDFDNPSGSRLGLFTAIQNIGGICALGFSSYAADIFGRRIGVCLGLLIVFLGTVLLTSCTNQRSRGNVHRWQILGRVGVSPKRLEEIK